MKDLQDWINKHAPEITGMCLTLALTLLAMGFFLWTIKFILQVLGVI